MKVKLAMALIGISSIHLLKTFINADKMREETMLWQVVIHVTFVFSALVLAWIDGSRAAMAAARPKPGARTSEAFRRSRAYLNQRPAPAGG